LFRQRTFEDQEVLLQLDEPMSVDWEPVYESRLRLKILKDVTSGRVTALVTELSFLGELVLFSGSVRQRFLERCERGLVSLKLEGHKFQFVLDESLLSTRMSMEQGSVNFVVRGDQVRQKLLPGLGLTAGTGL